MAGLKGVIFSLRGVLVQRQRNTALIERTVQLISFLHSRGIKTVFASNSHGTIQPIERPFEELIKERFGEQTFYYGGHDMDYTVRGEPVVCTPTDAFRCFMGTELDMLVVGSFVLFREEQYEALKENYEARYELD